eukprot:scaffold825_cov196-Alexandrium_tamarense.AAC.9
MTGEYLCQQFHTIPRKERSVEAAWRQVAFVKDNACRRVQIRNVRGKWSPKSREKEKWSRESLHLTSHSHHPNACYLQSQKCCSFKLQISV